ncbi:MAG: nucleotidyltransferase domain-containing protein [Melioribacter sp.]|nr:nucleotidyltransferase domain-containing protein [Melioribacter sp.]
MNSNKKYKIKIITDCLKSKEEVLFAYIFGSFVDKVQFHDIDVAVYLKDDFPKNDFKMFPYGYESGASTELTQLTREKIDFVIMNDVPLTFQKKIIEHGILLFCKNDRIRIYFENYVRKLYIDTEHLRKIRKYYLNKKIINA